MEQVLVTATCIERFMFSTIIHVQVVKYQNAFLKKINVKSQAIYLISHSWKVVKAAHVF